MQDIKNDVLAYKTAKPVRKINFSSIHSLNKGQQLIKVIFGRIGMVALQARMALSPINQFDEGKNVGTCERI